MSSGRTLRTPREGYRLWEVLVSLALSCLSCVCILLFRTITQIIAMEA